MINVKMETYKEMKDRQQSEYNNFKGVFYAFNEQQFNKGMKKLGLEKDDLNKIYRIGAGGYLLKTKDEEFKNMLDRFDKEQKERMNDLNFCISMFKYEMYNHEYSYTWELDDTLRALNLTMEEINNNNILKEALKIAKNEVLYGNEE